MKWILALAALVALLLSPAVYAETSNPRIDAAASVVAGRAVTVGCYDEDEPLSPGSIGAWGYVYLDTSYIYFDKSLCVGLLAIGKSNSKVKLWYRAVGAASLAHEAYHLNLKFPDRGNEAKTECRAIRGAAGTMRLFGATEAEVERLMPIALADHYRIGALFPQYNYPSCRVPWYW